MRQPDRKLVRAALRAGAAGGAAEVIWVAGYAGATGASGLTIAAEVTASVFPSAAGLAAAPLLGIGVHMLLSVALGLALAKLLLGFVMPRYGEGALVPAALAVLAGIWALNFMLVLPALHPQFVGLLPLAATFLSKLLFGAAAGWVLKGAVSRAA
jgi:hypothetical protein